MVFRCVKNMGGEFILMDTTPEQVNEYVRKHCREYYEIPPDVVIFRDTRIILESPMLVGFKVKKGKILVPFTKRCMGSFLVEIDAAEEDFEFFRNWSEEKQNSD
ncbi:MAG TPA: DUF1894 domain-containing protein [Methanoregulaceae archaeon]|nr:DUF1894 domain-containing protein [Methanoregulaceae archaeon]